MAALKSRRSFVGMVGVGALLGGSPAQAFQWFRRRRPPQPAPFFPPAPQPIPPAPQPVPQALYARKNISSLGPQLASLRAGVAYMKALPPTDNRSWTFQANIHKMNGVPSDTLFNQCPHHLPMFLPWHRGYLFFFERILRWASGDPSLSLPYWDWTNDKVLPLAFRQPADRSNSLFQGGRDCNDGQPLHDVTVDASLRAALDKTDYYGAARTGFTWSIEAPHDAVHGDIGGIMGEVATAANDPIFWLHHCNIDRLWDFWLNLGEGRANPTDPEYLDTQYTFADYNGAEVTHRVRDLLDSRTLGYTYSSVPSPAPSAPFAGFAMAAAPPAMVGPMHGMQAPGPVPGMEPGDSKPLGTKTETVKLDAPRPRFRVMAPPPRGTGAGQMPPVAPEPTLITVDGIEFDKLPKVSYGVYINIPEGQEPSEATAAHLVGLITFFAREIDHPAGGHKAMQAIQPSDRKFSQSFDATKVLARLKGNGLYKEGQQVTVTLQPILPKPPADPEAARVSRERTEALAKEANVRYKSVTIE